MTIIIEDVHLDGIPCQAEIDTWPAEPMTRHDPGCSAGWELCQVLDRRGRPADWLERKLDDPNIKLAFHDSVDDQLDKLAQQDAEDEAEYRYEQMMDRRMMGYE
jgi:hypothetical protein